MRDSTRTLLTDKEYFISKITIERVEWRNKNFILPGNIDVYKHQKMNGSTAK